MADKRNPTRHTEKRSGRDSADGPPDLPSDAERAEYTEYTRKDAAERTRPDPSEDQPDREGDRQPDGNPDESVRDAR
jgi:hypothetical protein